MKATYWQRGETLDYKNDTTDVMEANTVVALGAITGVTGTDINPGETGSLHVSGVFEMQKNSDEEIMLGTAVYFDGEQITATADGNTPAGYAARKADAGDETIAVKLLG